METAARKDETGRSRQQPLLANSARFQATAPIEALADELKRVSGEPLATLQAPEGVLCNITEQPRQKRLLIHLLNYTLHPVDRIKLIVQGRYKSHVLFSPDAPAQSLRRVSESHDKTEFEIPSLSIYSVITLN